MNELALVQKVWNYAHVLRDQGVSYKTYISQISCLLFLKMDDERAGLVASGLIRGESSAIPEDCRWPVLRDLQGEELTRRYSAILEKLSRRSGIVGTIFLKAQNEIQDPAKLRRLVGLIDGETWLGLGVDVKGLIYEGLLERNAQEVKSGAGQYFTLRALIDAMVMVIDPEPQETIHDPACGTGGFLLAAWEHMRKKPLARNAEVYSAMRSRFSGIDIVPEVVPLCAMNLYLHDIAGRESPVEARDALLGDHGKTYDMVLTNPPFGKKQSYRIVRDDGEIDTEREDYDRQDFFVTTSNKQLNFLQHIMTVLAENGRAAVVMPDNVLFEGGAGETIRRRLLHNFDFHTLLRLPTGIFYKQGVKANVLFFDKKQVSAEPNTRDQWIYDLRTNQRFTLKERPMTRADLDDYARRPRPAAAARRDRRRDRREPGSRTRTFPQGHAQPAALNSKAEIWLRVGFAQPINRRVRPVTESSHNNVLPWRVRNSDRSRLWGSAAGAWPAETRARGRRPGPYLRSGSVANRAGAHANRRVGGRAIRRRDEP
jgi:type I restriction enzyme M protein